MAVGGAHGGGGVARGLHGFFDRSGETVDGGGGGEGGWIGWWFVFPVPQMGGTCGTRRLRGRRFQGGKAAGELVEADGDSLAEVHRGLTGRGGDDYQTVTEAKVLAGKAALLGAEDQGHAASGSAQLGAQERDEIGQVYDRLLRSAVVEGGGAENQRAIGERLLECGADARGSEQVFRADGGLGLAPVGLVGGDHREAGEAEVGHGPRRRAYIEGIARGDQDDLEAVALAGRGQGSIVGQHARVLPARGLALPRRGWPQGPPSVFVLMVDSIELMEARISQTHQVCYSVRAGTFTLLDLAQRSCAIPEMGVEYD